MSNQTALITGATGGLGQEFVRIFGQNGVNLVLVGRNPRKLQALQDSTEQRYGVKVNTIAVDFTDNQAAEIIYNETKQLGQQVDYLVNNAGLGGQGTFLDRTMDRISIWQRLT